MEFLKMAAIIVAAYLLGSLNSAIIVSRLMLGVDIRNYGSGNAGSTNAFRTMGGKKALIVMGGDILKGVAAVAIGAWLAGDMGKLVAGVFVVVGHVFPLYFGFKGGKGVACSAAVVFFVDPLWGAVAIVACLAVIALTRFISLGSMTMLFCYMVLMCIAHWGQWAVCLFTVVLFAMCVWRHRSNIHRLLSGTENRIGQKAK